MLTKNNILMIEQTSGRRQLNLRRKFNKMLLRAGDGDDDSLIIDDDDWLYDMDGDNNRFPGQGRRNAEMKRQLKNESRTCGECKKALTKNDFPHEFDTDKNGEVIGIKLTSETCFKCIYLAQERHMKKKRRAALNRKQMTLNRSSLSSKKPKRILSHDDKISIEEWRLKRDLDQYKGKDRCTTSVHGFGENEVNGRARCQDVFDGRWKIVNMTPMDFLLLSYMIEETDEECKRIAIVKEVMKTYKPKIPYLEIGNMYRAKIDGHSGRHRVYEFLRQGCKQIEVAVYANYEHHYNYGRGTSQFSKTNVNGKEIYKTNIKAEDNENILATLKVATLIQSGCESDGNHFTVIKSDESEKKRRRIEAVVARCENKHYTPIYKRKRKKTKIMHKI